MVTVVAHVVQQEKLVGLWRGLTPVGRSSNFVGILKDSYVFSNNYMNDSLHDKSNDLGSELSKDLDQPGHPPILMSLFVHVVKWVGP